MWREKTTRKYKRDSSFGSAATAAEREREGRTCDESPAIRSGRTCVLVCAVCVEFRSKGSPVRGVGGGVRASATAGDPSRRRPTIDFLTPGGIAFSTAAAFPSFLRVFWLPLPDEIFGGGARGCTTQRAPTPPPIRTTRSCFTRVL